MTVGSHFNPRARVGRDSRSSSSTCSTRNFNPRARVGRDTTFPARWRRWWHFNPRARVGRDATASAAFASMGRFQSARPCGARLIQFIINSQQ